MQRVPTASFRHLTSVLPQGKPPTRIADFLLELLIKNKQNASAIGYEKYLNKYLDQEDQADWSQERDFDCRVADHVRMAGTRRPICIRCTNH